MRIRVRRGGDIVSTFISKIPVELHRRTLPKLKKDGYCGPNTNLQKRLDSNLNQKPGYEPINKVDEVCMRHDINYMLPDEGLGTRHEADKIMLDELDRLKNKDLSWQEWFGKYFTKPIIGLKYKLGLGFTEAQELHKRVVRKFKRRMVIAFNVNSKWASDLMPTSDFTNSKYTYHMPAR
jgi:hypothetical protein